MRPSAHPCCLPCLAAHQVLNAQDLVALMAPSSVAGNDNGNGNGSGTIRKSLVVNYGL